MLLESRTNTARGVAETPSYPIMGTTAHQRTISRSRLRLRPRARTVDSASEQC